ncbi:GNAT family protein [Streptomyces angustmyceticus]|uniref:N-acetyltransferase n=1 Tax=Streptomyces angustmyceticus TaxID=285578 RepID=A0A5J4LHZ5_9ACTN|nr:GNAT family protein [Streptomyces angustmyceticus]UAL67713.1 GNAT family N-acetyltransferase [Streptomyces angustmyceticus]GES31521.1 N-acetyltransferase [Streptomyces angustmyceticus]
MPTPSAPVTPPLPYTPRYPIRTERLDLRPVTPDDLPAIHAYQRRPEVCRYLYWGPLDEAGSRASVAAKAARTTLREPGDLLQLAVVVRESGTLVGDVTFVWRSSEHRQGGIGYVFHPDHAGHGYATEASRALLKLGFEELHLHRVQAELDGRNTASARLLERLGMRREGHLRENEFLDGEWSDEVVYAMLAREWRARQDERARQR